MPFMPSVIEKEITIDAPTDKVYNYLADIPRHSEWAGDPLTIEKTSEGPIDVGSTFASGGKMMGRELRDRLTVTALEPGRRIVTEVEGDTGRFVNEFVLDDEGGSTRLTKRSEAVKRAPLVQILSPIVSTFIIPRVIEADLRRIKTNVENLKPAESKPEDTQ